MEGGIDSSHVSFLHRGELNTDPLFKGSKGNQYNLGDMKPVFEVVESPGGLYIGARRNAENGNYYWRITQWVMPAFTMIPPRADHPVHGHFWMPIDDENCWAWSFDYQVDAPAHRRRSARRCEAGKGIHVAYVPGTLPAARQQGQRLPDRPRGAEGAAATYSGVRGIAMQDASLQESMGPIVDRTKENLVSTDNGIIMARHRLLRALKAMEKGETPPGVDLAHQRVRSAAVVLPPDQPSRTRRRRRWWCRAGRAARLIGLSRCRAESARMCERRRGALPHRRAELAAARGQGDRARPAERARGQGAGAARWNSATFFTASAFGERAAPGRELRRLAQRSRRPHQEPDRRGQQRRPGGDGGDRRRERAGRLDHRRGVQPQARDDDGAGARRHRRSPTRRCRRRCRTCGPGR